MTIASGSPALANDVLNAIAATRVVANGGTGLTSGNSGGVLTFSGTTGMVSSLTLVSAALILGGGASGTVSSLASGASGMVLTSTGSGSAPLWTSGPTGSVVAVGLTMPAGFTVAGSPVTSSGTLAVTFATAAANLFLATPSGGTGIPSLRAIVNADLPVVSQAHGGTNATSLSGARIVISASGVTSGHAAVFTDTTGLNIADGGSTLGTVTSISGNNGTIVFTPANVISTGTANLSTTTVTSGVYGSTTQVPSFTVDASGRLTAAANNAISLSGAGTVTSVGLALPGIFTVSGSPVTGAGTLTGTLANQSQNLVFAAPSGTAGTPTFRTLVNQDLPVVVVASGGTGITSGTAGGIPWFATSATIQSTAQLAANQIVLGGGATTPVTLGSLGTSVTVLHGGTGVPSFAPVSLTVDVTGVLGVVNGGTGTNASGATAANNIGAFAIANNLNEVGAVPATMRTSLGLGTAAVRNSSSSSTVVASVAAAVTSGHLAVFTDTAGTLGDGGSVGAGTVTSVGLSLPTGVFALAGTPVTTTGTLSGTFTSQSSGTFFAAPSGGAGTPAFRRIVDLDLPVVDVTHGGTGQSTGGGAALDAVSAFSGTTSGAVIRTGSATYALTPLGVGPSNIVQLNGSSQYPSTDGSFIKVAPTYAGSVQRTLRDMTADYVNVKDLGAVGDNSTDNTTVINTALGLGKNVYFPPGTYMTSGGHVISASGQYVVGAGEGATTLICSNAASGVFIIANGVHNSGAGMMTITRNIQPTVSGAWGIASAFQGNNDDVEDCRLWRLILTNHWNGLLLGPTNNGTVQTVTVSGCWDDGMQLKNVPGDTGTHSNPIQWSFSDHCGAEYCAGAGLAVRTVPQTLTGGRLSCGEILNFSTFANITGGFIAAGGVNCAIDSIRIGGKSFFGADGNTEIYLDTYGTNHVINDCYIELAGTFGSSTPPGGLGPARNVPATNIGYGIYLTTNNTGCQINGVTINGVSDEGIFTAANSLGGTTAPVTVVGCQITNCGLAGTPGAQTGVHCNAGSLVCVGNTISQWGGNNTQTYGVYTDTDNVIIANNNLRFNSTAGSGTSVPLSNSITTPNLM